MARQQGIESKGGWRSGDRKSRCVGHCGFSQLSTEKDFVFYSEENGDSLKGFGLCFKGTTQEIRMRTDRRG